MMLMVPKKKNNDKEYLNSLPPGFRFKPTDMELCTYLSSKIHGRRLPPNLIKNANLYYYDPVTLTGMSDNELFNGKNSEWYFFTPQNRKYPKGDRPVRTTGDGYWKMTGACERIEKDKTTLVGLKKKLVYYKGKPTNGIKTNWLMHEYVLDNPTPRTRTGPNDMRLNDWVLCRVYNKLESEKKKKQKIENLNPETSSLVREQNQEILEKSMANANEAVIDQEYACLSPLIESQHFQGPDHNFNMMPQTNSQMDFDCSIDDFTIGGLPEFPQLCHDLMLGNSSTTFPFFDSVLDYNTSIPKVPLPISAIPPNDDQLCWADYDNLDMHQIATSSNYDNFASTMVPPVSSIPPNDQSHREQ